MRTMSEKTLDEWATHLNKIALPLGYRVIHKWWCLQLYKTDPDTGIEYSIDVSRWSVKELEEYLKDLTLKKEKEQ